MNHKQCSFCGDYFENISWYWGKDNPICLDCHWGMVESLLRDEDEIGGWTCGTMNFPHVNLGGEKNYMCSYYALKKLNRTTIDGFPMRNMYVEFYDEFNQLWKGTCEDCDWNEYTVYKKVKK